MTFSEWWKNREIWLAFFDHFKRRFKIRRRKNNLAEILRARNVTVPGRHLHIIILERFQQLGMYQFYFAVL